MKKLFAMLLGFVLIGTMMSSIYAEHDLMSPKKQMNDGVSAEDVICKGGFTLMIRMGGDAACVTPSTASKLSSAGWGEILKEFEMQAEHEDEEITLNEGISMEDKESSDDEEDDKKVELKESMTMAGN